MLDRFNINHAILLGCLIILSVATKAINEIYPIRLCFRNLFSCAPFFFTGILLRQYKNCVGTKPEGNNSKSTICTATISFLYLIVFSIYLCTDGYKTLPSIAHAVLEEFAAFAMIVVLFYLANRVNIVANNKLLCKFGRSSLIIYLFHTYIIAVIKVVVKYLEVDWVIASILFTWFVPVLLSYLIYKLSEKVEWIGYIFKPMDGIAKFYSTFGSVIRWKQKR